MALQNAWWLASEALGDPDGFLLDVRTAGQATADDAATTLAQGSPAPGVGHELGYWLIQVSLNSHVQFIPPALIPRLLRLDRWTVEQALAYALRIPDPKNRSDTLLELLPFLSRADQDRVEAEIVVSVRQIGRAQLMITAAARLSPTCQLQLLQEALERVRSEDGVSDAENLARISAQVSAERAEALVMEAVAKASAVKDVKVQSDRLRDVAVLAHPAHRDLAVVSALRAASSIPDEWDDYYGDYQGVAAEVLVKIAPYLGAHLKDGIALAESIRPPVERVKAMAALLPFMPKEERHQRLSDAIQTARSAKGWEDYAQIPLLDYLPTETRDALCKRSLKYATADEITRLAPFLPAHLWPKATKLLLKHFKYPVLPRAAAVGATLRYAPEPYRDKVARKVLRKLPEFKDEEYLETTEVLNSLAEHVPDQLVPETIDALRVIGDDDARSEALTRLAPYLAHRSMPVLLEIARQSSPIHAASLLAAVADRLAGPELEEALAIASGFEDLACRATALTRLSAMLPDERRLRLLRAESARVRRSLPYKPEKLKGGGIQRGQQFQALAELSGYLDEEDRVALARYVLDLWPRLSPNSRLAAAPALPALYPRLPAPLATETMSMMLAMEFPGRAIGQVAPCLEPDRVREALVMTGQLSGRSKVAVIGELAPYLSGDLFDAALNLSLAETSYEDRMNLLKLLAPHAPEAGTDDMAARAHDLPPADGAELLVALLPALPRRRVRAACDEVLDLARQAHSRNPGATAGPDRVVTQLLKVAPQVPEPERAEVLDAAWRAASAAADPAALQEVARCLSRPLATVVHGELTSKLAIAQPADSKSAVSILDAALDRLTSLESVLPSVPEARKEHAVQIACLIHQDPLRLARELAEMSAHLSAAQTSEIWSMILAESQRIDPVPVDVLAALAESAPISVARPVVAASIMAACDGAARSWREDTSQLDRAVRSIGILSPEESHRVVSSVLSAHSVRPRWVALRILGRLAPAVAKISGEDGVATVVHAVQNVGRWWP